MTAIHITGMLGMGDNLYMRPFVRAALARYSEVYLTTAWPEAFADLPVRCVRPETNLRTQAKNAAAYQGDWAEPDGVMRVTLRYNQTSIVREGIIETFKRQAKNANFYDGEPLVYDMPPVPRPADLGPRYAVVRPMTRRKEWESLARGCDPAYIQQSIWALKERGYQIVSIADCDGDNEWFLGGEPRGVDLAQHQGEGGMTRLMSLVTHADVVVGGVGFIVPMAVFSRRNFFLIYGGRGAANGPAAVCHPSMPMENTEHVLPDNFCMCDHPIHNCDKTILGFEQRLSDFLARIEKPTL